MTATESYWHSGNPWAAARASLIPWAAVLVAAAVADMWVHHEFSAIGLAAAAPGSLVFVALPAMVPLVVARAGATLAGVLIVMTAVATISAVLVVTTDDAQAGSPSSGCRSWQSRWPLSSGLVRLSLRYLDATGRPELFDLVARPRS